MKDFSVFVLDDDVMFCEMLTVLATHEIFTSQLPGYDVVFTIHSDIKKLDKEVDCIKDIKPDLVILDYMLGMEVNSCIQSLDLLKQIIPYCSDIQMISGLGYDDARLEPIREALADTNIGLLAKPFNISTLVGVIRESIKRKEGKENGQYN